MSIHDFSGCLDYSPYCFHLGLHFWSIICQPLHEQCWASPFIYANKTNCSFIDRPHSSLYFLKYSTLCIQKWRAWERILVKVGLSLNFGRPRFESQLQQEWKWSILQSKFLSHHIKKWNPEWKHFNSLKISFLSKHYTMLGT